MEAVAKKLFTALEETRIISPDAPLSLLSSYLDFGFIFTPDFHTAMNVSLLVVSVERRLTRKQDPFFAVESYTPTENAECPGQKCTYYVWSKCPAFEQLTLHASVAEGPINNVDLLFDQGKKSPGALASLLKGKTLDVQVHMRKKDEQIFYDIQEIKAIHD